MKPKYKGAIVDPRFLAVDYGAYAVLMKNNNFSDKVKVQFT
jgi:hypothetical protein